jgi:hypothetical protein
MSIEESKHLISEKYIIHQEHFQILDEVSCIWFAYVHTEEDPNHVFPIIARESASLPITATALYTLITCD